MAKAISSIEIDGIDDLKKQLSLFKGQDRKNALKDILDAGGRIVEAHAKINVNEKFSDKQKGHLAGSIQTRVKVSSTKAEATIGPEGVIYARIHELGGVIVPRNAKALHWVSDTGEDIFAKKVVIPPRPDLRPALDENVEEITQAMRITLDKLIWRRLGGR